MPIRLIGVDADDTLWHNEPVFRMTHQRFNDLLQEFAHPDDIEARLNETERRNIGVYGYGAKGFTLSMIETALSVSDSKVSTAAIKEILEAGREMMLHPHEPLPGIEDALKEMAKRGRLILITKGDLFHQEQKLAASGLGQHFSGVEIVSEKNRETYHRVFARYGSDCTDGVMVGNSMKSDVLPMLAAGGYAALAPYPLVWAHEAAEAPVGNPRYRELTKLADLPGWIDEIGYS